jgi:hypothetical protein
MSYIGRSIHRIGNWIVSNLAPKYAVMVVEEFLPDHLNRKTLYIVQEDGYREQGAMICPCGCKQILHMNMLSDERPCWSLREHSKDSHSLYPSIWRTKGCHSHFWFCNNRIQWCKGGGPWWNKL